MIHDYFSECACITLVNRTKLNVFIYFFNSYQMYLLQNIKHKCKIIRTNYLDQPFLLTALKHN